MKLYTLVFILFYSSVSFAQQAGDIDLTHWKLELPSGYTASEWKLSQFQEDSFAQPFFYLDSLDGALVMKAFPVVGTSKAKYTKTSLREQMEPGESSKNWSLSEGGRLKATFQLVEISKKGKKYDRTLLFQIHGTTSKSQNKELALAKSVSVPLLSIYWQDERIRVVRKTRKSLDLYGDELIDKAAWQDDKGRYFNKKVGFEKATIEIIASEGRIEVKLNNQKPIIYRDSSIKKWPFENYFNAGNYLQTKNIGSISTVKYYALEVSH
ncbi:polysaccharide lyase family 7 protein [Roseivirga sp.]|uniref:polysaccharide lyase family 7 protein n=1 Tax=Roseivirga sp. TaxID=1964215 RepID=UPI003B8B2DE4